MSSNKDVKLLKAGKRLNGRKFDELREVKIEVGTVQINFSPQRGPDHFPFLGVKGSGVGVQGIRYTLEAMTRPKSVVLNKPE